ncbi:hypothetical protein ACWENQ_44735 [Nonomuraea sp. NPDC004354]
MSHVVYARVDSTVVWSGGQSPIGMGEVWDSEAPLVRERPDLFSTEPTRVRGRVARPAEAAEDAEEDGPAEAPAAEKRPRRRG